MKPIDTITGLPRSAEVSRLASALGRQGELQGQSQTASFAREMQDRQNSVGESHKPDKGSFDSEGGSGEGSYEGNPGAKQEGEREKEAAASQEPGKGRILDIRGS